MAFLFLSSLIFVYASLIRADDASDRETIEGRMEKMLQSIEMLKSDNHQLISRVEDLETKCAKQASKFILPGETFVLTPLSKNYQICI